MLLEFQETLDLIKAVEDAHADACDNCSADGSGRFHAVRHIKFHVQHICQDLGYHLALGSASGQVHLLNLRLLPVGLQNQLHVHGNSLNHRAHIILLFMLRLDSQKRRAGVRIPPGAPLTQHIRQKNQILRARRGLLDKLVHLVVGHIVAESPPYVSIRTACRLHGSAGHVFTRDYMGKAEYRLIRVNKGLCGGSADPCGGSVGQVKLSVLNAGCAHCGHRAIAAAADNRSPCGKPDFTGYPVLNIACHIDRAL